MTAGKSAGAKALPPITVGKMADAGHLIERLVAENTSLFSDRIKEYREARSDGATRSLTAEEAAQVAAGLADAATAAGDPQPKADIAAFTARIQQSELKAQEAVPQAEVLLIAGLATAPAAIEAVQQLVGLIEMPTATYRKAREEGTLDDAVRSAGQKLEDVDLTEGRQRAARALDHFQEAAGAQVGEVIGLIRDMMGQAIAQAAVEDLSSLSPFDSLTGSLAPTDGTEA